MEMSQRAQVNVVFTLSVGPSPLGGLTYTLSMEMGDIKEEVDQAFSEKPMNTEAITRWIEEFIQGDMLITDWSCLIAEAIAQKLENAPEKIEPGSEFPSR